MASRIDPTTALADCPDVPVNTRQPAPISERLDELVAVANLAGARTNRTELIGTMLFVAPEDRAALLEHVLAFRQAKASDASLKNGNVENVLQFRRHPRGPRKRVNLG
jgi:hypothetical protein